MKIVVTGALGHIGSALIREPQIVEMADEIVMIDDLSTQRYSSLFNLPDGVKYSFLQGDVQDQLTPSLLAGAAAVVHLAGTISPVASFADPESTFGNNLRITTHVSDMCELTGTPLIFASTTSVYTTTNRSVDESSKELHPASPYAQCKLLEEQCVLSGSSAPALILRFGTIFGVSRGMRFHTAVNKFCWQAAIGSEIEIWSSAMDQMRPYLAVSDAASAISHAIRNEIYPDRVLNAASCSSTVREIVEVIEQCGVSPQVRLVDSEAMNELSFAASTQYASTLGFSFPGSLRAGIRETLCTLDRLSD